MSRPRRDKRGLDPAFWIADADRDEKRFIVRADEKLPAFVELERRFSLAAVNTVYWQTITMSKRRRTTER